MKKAILKILNIENNLLLVELLNTRTKKPLKIPKKSCKIKIGEHVVYMECNKYGDHVVVVAIDHSPFDSCIRCETINYEITKIDTSCLLEHDVYVNNLYKFDDLKNGIVQKYIGKTLLLVDSNPDNKVFVEVLDCDKIQFISVLNPKLMVWNDEKIKGICIELHKWLSDCLVDLIIPLDMCDELCNITVKQAVSYLYQTLCEGDYEFRFLPLIKVKDLIYLYQPFIKRGEKIDAVLVKDDGYHIDKNIIESIFKQHLNNDQLLVLFTGNKNVPVLFEEEAIIAKKSKKEKLLSCVKHYELRVIDFTVNQHRIFATVNETDGHTVNKITDLKPGDMVTLKDEHGEFGYVVENVEQTFPSDEFKTISGKYYIMSYVHDIKDIRKDTKRFKYINAKKVTVDFDTKSCSTFNRSSVTFGFGFEKSNSGHLLNLKFENNVKIDEDAICKYSLDSFLVFSVLIKGRPYYVVNPDYLRDHKNCCIMIPYITKEFSDTDDMKFITSISCNDLLQFINMRIHSLSMSFKPIYTVDTYEVIKDLYEIELNDFLQCFNSDKIEFKCDTGTVLLLTPNDFGYKFITKDKFKPSVLNTKNKDIDALNVNVIILKGYDTIVLKMIKRFISTRLNKKYIFIQSC